MTHFDYLVHPELWADMLQESLHLGDEFHEHNFQRMEQALCNTLHLPVISTIEGMLKRERWMELTSWTCKESLSTSLNTATVLIPSFLAVRMTRQAISPLGKH
jgi:hypothetical protein